MKGYHKINSIFKRDLKTNKFTHEYSRPEFEYLKDCQWEFTEKVDGTNVRISWDGNEVKFGGRTDNAQMPMPLIERLQILFTKEKLASCFPEGGEVVLYGEGYGGKIQSGGKYKPEVDFVLFDVCVGPWWLKREAVNEVAFNISIQAVPVIGYGTLAVAIDLVRDGLKSTWGDFIAEGLVIRPAIDLTARNGERIITKVKGRDFI